MNNKEQLIWLAGMFEGEGTTGLFKGKRAEKRKNGSDNWRIYSYWLITNNDAVIIDRVKEILKSYGINLSLITRDERGKNHNINYQVGTKKMADTHKILSLIFPYLIGQKKYIAKLTMEFIESREFGKVKTGHGYSYSNRDFQLLNECKQYNQRGPEKKKLESSEAIRLALLQLEGDDMVRTSMKVGECIVPKQYE